MTFRTLVGSFLVGHILTATKIRGAKITIDFEMTRATCRALKFHKTRRCGHGEVEADLTRGYLSRVIVPTALWFEAWRPRRMRSVAAATSVFVTPNRQLAPAQTSTART